MFEGWGDCGKGEMDRGGWMWEGVIVVKEELRGLGFKVWGEICFFDYGRCVVVR